MVETNNGKGFTRKLSESESELDQIRSGESVSKTHTRREEISK
mgnify:CR=1 FL=1